MRLFHKKSKSKDLNSWIGKSLKVILNADGFYEDVLLEEQKNGILIEVLGKRVYVAYEGILSIEEL